MTTKDPQEVAISVLSWLAGKPELFSRFLALSGLEADRLRQAASEPGFLTGVLSFLMTHEPTLMEFSEDTETAPDEVVAAFMALGGEGENW